ncbi:MAG: hypothetical protein [Bacteriophage sp.]|nr:MAG: hypothetical protein [Bacteriophage sp.]
MDAVKFIEEHRRMYKVTGKHLPTLAEGIPAEDVVKEVEEWSAAHQRKTRQDVFLEQWPNAARDRGGVVNICPKLLDVDISCTDDETERTGLCKACDDCRREFLMQEVE